MNASEVCQDSGEIISSTRTTAMNIPKILYSRCMNTIAPSCISFPISATFPLPPG